MLLLVWICVVAASAGAQEASTPTPPSASTEKLADLERVLLKKLKDIEERLERLERDRKTAETANDRKMDQLQRDVADTKRTVDRMERVVQRLETKR